MTLKTALNICAQAARERAEDRAELGDAEHKTDIKALRMAARIVAKLAREVPAASITS